MSKYGEVSPLLCNINTEEIFKLTPDGVSTGATLSWKSINNITFANSTVTLAEDLESLQDLLNCITKHSEKYGVDINAKENKYRITSKGHSLRHNLTING